MEHKVELGFKERTFKYTRKDREEYEEITGRGLWKSIQEDILALDEDSNPTPGGKFKAQRLLVWIGLRHEGRKVTQDAVGQWIDELAQKGGNEMAVYNTAVAAVLTSGVLGIKYQAEEDEEAEGKDSPEPTPTA